MKLKLFIRFTFCRLRQENECKPLVLMLSWAHAREKDFEKFCSIYADLGFDVLVVKINVWHVLRPMNGSLLAVDIVKFLANNDYYRQILLHGFSVGGFIWGECLVHLHGNTNFTLVSERIKAQVWDSIAGMKEIPIGVGKTVFLKNDVMQKAMERFLLYYLQLHKNDAENYYIPSESHFHNKAIQAPALIFSSKTDFIGTERLARKLARNFRAQKIPVTSKCFDDSPHVKHFVKYKDEYVQHLMNHLKLCELIEKWVWKNAQI